MTLLIESQAKMRLAYEYGAAQERGEAQHAGGDRITIVPHENNGPATVTDLGLTRKEIHEGRQIGRAEGGWGIGSGRQEESVPTAKGISLKPSLLRPVADVPEEAEAEGLLSGYSDPASESCSSSPSMSAC